MALYRSQKHKAPTQIFELQSIVRSATRLRDMETERKGEEGKQMGKKRYMRIKGANCYGNRRGTLSTSYVSFIRKTEG